MRKSIGRSQAHSGALIAPFVEWHAVVARTPEEVEDGLVLMRDAIRDAIRDDYGARMHLLLLLGIESESSVVIRGNQRAQHREVLTSFSSFALSRNRLSRTPYANWLNLSSAIEPPLPYSCTNWSGTKEAKL